MANRGGLGLGGDGRDEEGQSAEGTFSVCCGGIRMDWKSSAVAWGGISRSSTKNSKTTEE